MPFTPFALRTSFRCRRYWGLVAVAGLLLFTRASAHTIATETSVGKTYRALSLLGTAELSERTALLVGYAGARLDSDVALSHQVSTGIEQLLSPRFLLSGQLMLSPQARTSVPLDALRTYTVGTSYVGGSVGALMSSGSFRFLEHALDVSLSAYDYQLKRELVLPIRSFHRADQLASVRTALGYTATFNAKTDLSARAAYTLYDGDPLTTGSLGGEELTTLEKRLGLLRQRAVLRTQSLVDANAASGLATAPIQFELRASLLHRFSRVLRLQASYSYLRFVPTQGFAHVPSLRLTYRALPSLRLWATVAIQVDAPEDAAPSTSGLATLGVEWSFGETVL